MADKSQKKQCEWLKEYKCKSEKAINWDFCQCCIMANILLRLGVPFNGEGYLIVRE